MFHQKIFALALCFLLFGQISAQDKPNTDSKEPAISAELKKDAVAFLREAGQDVSNLRTLENRISFSAEIASLMWFHDEKEARTMFQTVITDFRQLMNQTEMQYTALGDTEKDETSDPFFGSTQTSQTKLMRKMSKAMNVRQQIALSISEHDPQMGYDFFIQTSQAVVNPDIRSMIENTDLNFEFKLLNTIAENDADKALELGRKKLGSDFNWQLIELLKKIYKKDAGKGAAFGDEIVQKIKSEKTKADSFYEYSSILNLGAENLDAIKTEPGKKPIFSEQSLRDIADLLAQEIVKRDADSGLELDSYISLVERFSPARAAQIKQKFAKKNANKTSSQTNQVDENKETVSLETNRQLQNQTEMSDQILQSVKDGKKLSDMKVSKEQRDKIIDDSLLAISKMKNSGQKLMALTMLAAQVAEMGDKETASKIVDDARKLVPAEPKNYQDFLLIWSIASSYSGVNADKAFPMIEDAILRINDTISAFIKVGEFMDTNAEIIEDGEVQVGSMGADMSRELLGSLSSANGTLRNLAIADFARTKALTNKFDRPEARILAKMLILRAIFGDSGKIEGK